MNDSQKAPRSILIVDDEPIVLLDIADFFTDVGFKVFEAGSADDAIVVLEENPNIQTVITDVRMPGSMDGVELAHFIRDRWPSILLVVTSGARPIAGNELPNRTMFVAKPFDPNFVLSEIDRLTA